MCELNDFMINAVLAGALCLFFAACDSFTGGKMELGIDVIATRSALIDGLHSPDGAALSAALDAMILSGNCEPRQRLRVLRILEAQPGSYKKTAIRQMIAMLEADCDD